MNVAANTAPITREAISVNVIMVLFILLLLLLLLLCLEQRRGHVSNQMTIRIVQLVISIKKQS
jgi:hypothetical protein